MNDRFFFVHGLRTLVHCLLFLGFIAYQFTQPLFLNADVWVISYFLLFVALSLDFFGFYFYEKIKEYYFIQHLFFTMDAVLVTIGFFYMSLPALSSLLMYVYFFQIISAGFIGKYKSAFTHCLLISLLFSWILILKPLEVAGSSSVLLVFSIGNLFFMLAAGVGGLLGFQANKINWSLRKANKDFSQLRNINQLIVQNIKMGLFITDEENTIVYANQQALRILNTPSHSLGSVHDIFPRVNTLFQKEGKQAKKFNSIKVQYKDNEDIKTIGIFASPFLDHSSGLNRHLILFQDCTIDYQREKDEREQDKLISIGRMAKGIAQGLKTPLSSISNSIQSIDIHNKESFKNKKLMNIAQEKINHLNNTIGDFLSYAQSENKVPVVPLEGVHVNGILESLLDQISHHKEWSHIHHYITLKAHGFIEGHPDKLQKAFFHIIKNSCEAMEDKKEGANLSIETFDDNEWVVIRIKDTGSGIDERDKPHIFEPFYSTKVDGSGLGLAVAHKWVSQYNGSISFGSTDREETLCTLRFPNQPTLLPEEVVKQQRKIA